MIVGNKKAQKRKRGVLIPSYKQYTQSFNIWMERLNYAPSTVNSNIRKLDYFFEYLQSLSIYSIYEIQEYHINSYNKQLHNEKLSGSYIRSFIQAIRNFNRYLLASLDYQIPVGEITIEKHVHQSFAILTKQEIQQLFTHVENTLMGMRDKVMLHLLYSCGLRCEEVTRVRSKDIDYHKHLVYVQPGKTRLGRYVPLHPTITKELKEYEMYARPLINPKGKYFIVNYRNDQCTTKVIARSLQRIIKNTNISKKISPHCLRHSIATHLLQQGMAIEYIQQFLGHKSLQTTQMYVRMNHQTAYEN